MDGGIPLSQAITEYLGWLEFDRLLTASLSGHQVVINGHALCPPLSFVRAAILSARNRAVERPQRREDERPGRSAVSCTARNAASFVTQRH